MQRGKYRFRRTKSGSTYMVIRDEGAQRLLVDKKKRERFADLMKHGFGFRNMTGPFASRRDGNSEWRVYFT